MPEIRAGLLAARFGTEDKQTRIAPCGARYSGVEQTPVDTLSGRMIA